MSLNPDDIRRLEEKLIDPSVRQDRAALEALLAEDFFEFGASGRVWSREDVIEGLLQESGRAMPEIAEFAVRSLAGDVVLATYRTLRGEGPTLRSSIWRLREGRWQLAFHQGTRV